MKGREGEGRGKSGWGGGELQKIKEESIKRERKEKFADLLLGRKKLSERQRVKDRWTEIERKRERKMERERQREGERSRERSGKVVRYTHDQIRTGHRFDCSLFQKQTR